jgi:hypothetical protein
MVRKWSTVPISLSYTTPRLQVAPYLGRAGYPMDPRHYFKVTRTGCGAMEGSRVVHGVVLRKNVLHRRM